VALAKHSDVAGNCAPCPSIAENHPEHRHLQVDRAAREALGGKLTLQVSNIAFVNVDYQPVAEALFEFAGIDAVVP
jgi:hypothetical protein